VVSIADEIRTEEPAESAQPARPSHTESPVDSTSLHRTVALLAIASLFLGTLASFDALIWTHPVAGIAIMIGYAMALGLGVMAFVVRRRGGLLVLDLGILICTLLIRMPQFLLSLAMPQAKPNIPYTTDEGPLVATAANALAHGQNPYTAIWAGAHVATQPGVTATMSGRVVDRFDYPPVSAVLAAWSQRLLPTQPSAAIAAFAGLLAATILLFILLPAPWRSAGTMVCLGLGLYLMPLARQGYPEIIVLPFMVIAVNRWSRIGATGRLRGLGIASAIGLGLASATQQTVWFLVPFLVVGLLLLRVGDQGARTGWWLIVKYVVITVGTFAIVNAPFAIWNLRAWASATIMPLGIRDVPHGQGLIGLTYAVFNGSGRLQAFTYATAAFAVGLLACYALFIRTLGPAMVMLPWSIFFLSIRSSDRYFYILAPAWVVSVATVRHRDFARAWTAPLRIRAWRPLDRRWARAVIAVAMFVPAAALVTVAVATPPPLRMSVLAVTTSKFSYTNEILISATNTSTKTIAPHFALSSSVSIGNFWIIAAGPPKLKPGQSAVYALLPAASSDRRSLWGPRVVLRAMSAYPETLSSVTLPML
jgi:hypothetical protein